MTSSNLTPQGADVALDPMAGTPAKEHASPSVPRRTVTPCMTCATHGLRDDCEMCAFFEADANVRRAAPRAQKAAPCLMCFGTGERPRSPGVECPICRGQYGALAAPNPSPRRANTGSTVAPSVLLTLPYPISANRYWASRTVTPRGKPAFTSTYVTPEAKAYKAQVQ